ncbi:MAG: SpoIIE family protein phosphatase [Lachnospiraceae bacterium]|nr:SpoIIE family protein phosphatase [Lachnospiraceae bacterium]
METKKRVSIQRRIFRMVMIIVTASLLITSIVGIVSMLMIRNISSNALKDMTEDSILQTATGKSELADTELGKYEEYINEFAVFLHELYEHPEDYVEKEVPPLDARNAGVLTMQRVPASEDVDQSVIDEEALLLSNIEQILYPVMSDENSVIAAVYLGTEKGQILCYDTQSDIKPGTPYNYFESTWYQKAKEEQQACFTDVYLDSFGRGLTITCMAPFYDENNTFAGVVGMDIVIADLYKAVVEMNLPEGSYAMLVDNAGNEISVDGTEKALAEDAGMDQATLDKIMSKETGVSLTGQGVYYGYSPVETTDWMYCIELPEAVVMQPVNYIIRFIQTSILIFVVVFVLVALTAFFVVRGFTKKLTDPILALGKDAAEISGGNLDHRAEVVSNDEVGDLAKSFNDMAGSLKQYIEDLTAVTAEKERIGAELNVATKIQADMLPSIFPAFPERKDLDIYASMDPAKEVGGDFYDMFMVDEGHLAVVIADVSGKGVPAALFMVIAKTLLKNHLQAKESVEEVLINTNKQLSENNDEMLFVTAWVAVIDLATGYIEYSDAGHEVALVIHADGTVEEIRPQKKKPPLATMDGIQYRKDTFTLEKGDKLFIYTDGVPEATNADGELYGMKRLEEILAKNIETKPDQILVSVREDVDRFVGEAPQFDDLTMLAFMRV